MRLTTSSSMHVIKKEEKEAKLANFISEAIREQTTGAETAKICSIVAHSQTSPVIHAAAAMIEELTAAGFVVQVVLANMAKVEDENTLFAMNKLAAHGCCRVLKDRRLLDAHEQLVIGKNISWIGDSMRRDPLKSDSYERYANNDSNITRWATSSFERLWLCAKPLKTKTSPFSEKPVQADLFMALGKNDESESRTASAGTRH